MRLAGTVLAALAMCWAGEQRAGTTSAQAVAAPTAAKSIKVTVNGASLLLGWSPDGKWILYRDMGRRVQPGGTLWEVSTDGRQRHELVAGNVQDAAFLPDGRHLLYVESRTWPRLVLVALDLQSGSGRTWRLDRDEVLPTGVGGFANYSPSLSQAMLADGHLTLLVSGWVEDFNPLSGHFTRLSTRSLAIKNVPYSTNPSAAISPDRRFVAVLAAGKFVRVLALPSGHHVKTFMMPQSMDAAVWSPNSHFLALEGGGGGAAAIGGVRLITTRGWTGRIVARLGLETTTAFSWSPDSRYLTFSDAPRGSETDRVNRIMLVGQNLPTLVTLQLAANQAQPGQSFARWSPDGSEIAYTRTYGPAFSVERYDVYVARVSPSG